MPDVLIRNIDSKKLAILKANAAKNNRSLQAELHEMIDAHTSNDLSNFKNMVMEIQAEYKAEGKLFSDSTEDIRDLRDER